MWPPNQPLATPYIFGSHRRSGMAPKSGGANRPYRCLMAGGPSFIEVPAGDYLVQVVLNRARPFFLARARAQLPPDKGEGQQRATKPGVPLLQVRTLRVDPARPRGGIRSRSGSAAHHAETRHGICERCGQHTQRDAFSRVGGREMLIGAYSVLLPKLFRMRPNARFPLMVFHGHFPTGISDFRTTPRIP